MLTSFVSKTDNIFSTFGTVVGTLLVFFQASLTDQLSTAVDLLWVSGHTLADQTEEFIRRGLHKLMVIASDISSTG